jgi:hypothetical protein
MAEDMMSTAALTRADFDIGATFEQRSRFRIRRRTRASEMSAIASYYDPEFDRLRVALAAAIQSFSTEGLTWSDRDPTLVDPASAESAIAFLCALPSTRELPKISPDGEGGVMLIWESGQETAMITVDGTMLLPVINPGRPTSAHMQAVAFDGETVPPAVLGILPRR